MMPTFAITQKEYFRTIRVELDEVWLTKPFSMDTPKFKLDGFNDIECWITSKTTCSTGYKREQHVELNLHHTIVNPAMTNSNQFRDYLNCKVVPKTPDGGHTFFLFGMNLFRDVQGWSACFSGDDLLKCVVNGRVTFVITVTYAPPYCVNNDASSCNVHLLSHEMMQFDEQSCDLKIVVGDLYILAHKAFLTLISPVFAAMFAHNTKEAQTGTIHITDFDYATVKTAIEMLYGHPFEPHLIHEVIAVTRFAEKYMIKTAVDRLEKWLASNLTVDNFGAIVEYAWTHSCDKLKRLCANFHHQHAYPGFPLIDPVISAEMVKLLD